MSLKVLTYWPQVRSMFTVSNPGANAAYTTSSQHAHPSDSTQSAHSTQEVMHHGEQCLPFRSGRWYLYGEVLETRRRPAAWNELGVEVPLVQRGAHATGHGQCPTARSATRFQTDDDGNRAGAREPRLSHGVVRNDENYIVLSWGQATHSPLNIDNEVVSGCDRRVRRG